MRSPSADRTSSPTMTVRSAVPRSRARKAPSIRSWSVMARWVSPMRRALATSEAGSARESNEAELWQCRSRKHRETPTAMSDPLHQGLPEEVEVLERESRAQGYTVQRVFGDVTGNTRDLGQQ